ncbi:hypothetical protein GCM10027298_03700 [Epidermidibacterium keratini]
MRGASRRNPHPGPPATYRIALRARRPADADAWVRWPDFRLPASDEQALRVLTEAWQRAAHERVEIACGGGKGRTGTALAIIAILSGVSPGDAVGWVREHYDPRAVETQWQRRWVRRFHRAEQP